MRSSIKQTAFNYCYWSIAVGDQDTASIQESIESARKAGIYRPFHIMTDRELDDCECYDAMSVDNPDGMNKLIYLKAAISRLSYDYFIWIEPSTRFQREPKDPLKALRRAPLHVPLCRTWPGDKFHEKERLVQRFMIDSGLPSEPYFGTSAFWIIQHQAVELITSTAVGFWRKAVDQGLPVDVDAAMAFTMQLFCGTPRKHQWTENPELWLPKSSHTPLPVETLRKAAIIDIGRVLPRNE